MKPGPPRVYDLQISLPLTKVLDDHLGRIAARAGVSKTAIMRAFIQDSLDKANGVYSAFPSAEAMAEAALEYEYNTKKEN